MPLLENPRHERFAEGIACRNLSATTSYIESYPNTSEEAARRSASELMTKPDVRARIAEFQAEISNRSVAAASLERSERIARLERRATQLDSIIAQRASHPELEGIPGADTGHIWYTWKAAGKELCKEFGIDFALLKELRAVEQQCAQEMGEWLVKTAMDLRTDMPTVDIPENASIEDIRVAKAKMQEALDGLRKVA